MRALLWHRCVILIGPGVWLVARRLRGVLAWISRVTPRIRLERRNGRLQDAAAARQQLEFVLRPLDILVERGPLKLSDGLIPGYFKHVAVYLGREYAEIVRTSVSENGNPVADCCRGLAVLEATRDGVQLVSLEDVLDVDSIGVLRVAAESPAETRLVLARAARELGKEYDYVFDVNDYRKQYCCKLLSCLFPGLPSAAFLGAGAAVVPDDFMWPVIGAQPGAPLLALLIHQGVPIASDQQAGVLKKLLRDGCHRGSSRFRLSVR